MISPIMPGNEPPVFPEAVEDATTAARDDVEDRLQERDGECRPTPPRIERHSIELAITDSDLINTVMQNDALRKATVSPDVTGVDGARKHSITEIIYIKEPT